MKLALKILFSVVALFVLSGIGGYFYMRRKFTPPANQLTVAGLPVRTPFVWRADTTDGHAMPHAGLLIPVQLPNCPRTCYLQFDTGAPYSVLYAPSLAALHARYPALPAAAADTVRNFRFALGNGQVQARWMLVLPRGGSALPADSTAPFIIGTLGSDVVDGRALVLDYARRRFTLAASVPDSLVPRTDFVPLAFTNRRVLLSMGVQGEPRQLMFDTGSSAFALMTSKGNWEQMAQPGAVPRTAVVNSWGHPLTSYTVATLATLNLNAVALPLRTVTYIEGTTPMQNLLTRFSGLGGMLGNAPFAERTVILDVRNERFGLVRP